MADPDAIGAQPWTFSAEELLQSMEAAHAAAAEETPRPISLQEACQLVPFYVQKLPALCGLCGAPSEVRWTATVYYRRFFAVRSPMEFDPAKVMFASVHLACMIEEVHEITLDKLLESTGLGQDKQMPAKIAALEVPLLEGIGFALLVEPKPDAALRMLVDDLRRHLEQEQQSGEGEARDAAFRSEAELGLQEAFRDEVLQAAEDLTLLLSIRTDAVLRWPLSIVLAASLHATLEDAAATHGVAGGTLASALYHVLDAGVATQPQRAALRDMMAEALSCIRGLPQAAAVTQEDVLESVKPASHCQDAFEKRREEQLAQQEALRKVRKQHFRQHQGGS